MVKKTVIIIVKSEIFNCVIQLTPYRAKVYSKRLRSWWKSMYKDYDTRPEGSLKIEFLNLIK